MGIFRNLRLRRKLLIAMAPLALMVIVAGVYSSFESNTIDARYSALIDNQVEALRNVGEGRAHTNRFGLFLYELIDEADPIEDMRLTENWKKFAPTTTQLMTAALQESPERADKINAASAFFDQAEADARPVRAAALAGNTAKALDLMRGGVNQELQRAREATIEIMQDLQKYIDQRSDDLTRNTQHAILITWLVIGFGLLASWAAAFYIAETKVVNELLSLQGQHSKIWPTNAWIKRSLTLIARMRLVKSDAPCALCKLGARERETQGG